MAHYNPEKGAWRGKSYNKGGKRVRDLRDDVKAQNELRDRNCDGLLLIEEVTVSQDDIERLISRAETLLGFMDRDSALVTLIEAGVQAEMAYLVISAAGVK